MTLNSCSSPAAVGRKTVFSPGMKKFRFAAGMLLLSSVFAAGGCSTDLDLNAEFVETPVLFGLLDIAEDTHFIRINRAFLKEGESALLLARDPAEIYYGPGLQVRIEEYNDDNLVSSKPLLLVNGDSLGRSKNLGAFAEVPNLLYRHVGVLNPDRTYRVVAEDPALDINVSAETEVLDNFSVVRPTPTPTLSTSLSFASLADYQVRWNNTPGAKVYELHMRFYIKNVDAGDVTVQLGDTIYDWRIFNQELVDNPNLATALDYDIPRPGFYSFLRAAANPEPGVIRIVDSVDFQFYAGDQELYNYLLFGSSQLGITADQISATYTNVDGGLGLLASRHLATTPKYKFNNQTLDSIACGSITGGLNYAASGDSPFYPFCP
ncbi:MAG: DUF4249 family protein [Bacteroidetes bacterium]|nr:DUF4249 family protein [Bacteroidota bacterium]